MDKAEAKAYLIGLIIGLIAGGSIGFALGQRSADYNCSTASLERAYIAGADRLYSQLVEQGRLNDD